MDVDSVASNMLTTDYDVNDDAEDDNDTAARGAEFGGGAGVGQDTKVEAGQDAGCGAAGVGLAVPDGGLGVPRLVHTASFYLEEGGQIGPVQCPPSPRRVRGQPGPQLRLGCPAKLAVTMSPGLHNSPISTYFKLMAPPPSLNFFIIYIIGKTSFDVKMADSRESFESLAKQANQLKPFVRKDTSMCMIAPADFRLTPRPQSQTLDGHQFLMHTTFLTTLRV